MNLRFTLAAEGSTDAALIRILKWAVRRDRRIQEIEARFAEPGQLPPPRAGLTQRIEKALELYPADLLFVHRDTDNFPFAARREEVMEAVSRLARPQLAVPVVPVRMTEAWLLIDEAAIRRAAGNPSGTVALNLPRPRAIENLADPKAVLYEALHSASELSGRRRRKFNVVSAAGIVPEHIRDFEPLRQLPAFLEFESTLRRALDSLNA